MKLAAQYLVLSVREKMKVVGEMMRCGCGSGRVVKRSRCVEGESARSRLVKSVLV